MSDDTYQALLRAVDRAGPGGPQWTPALALADWCADHGHRFHELALRLWHRAHAVWEHRHGWAWYGVLDGQTWALEAVPRLHRYRGYTVVDERAARKRPPARLPADLSGDFHLAADPGAGSWVWSGPVGGRGAYTLVRTLSLTPAPAGPTLEALFLPLLEAVAAGRAKVPPRLWRGGLRFHATGRVVRPPAHNPNQLHRRFCRPFLVHT